MFNRARIACLCALTVLTVACGGDPPAADAEGAATAAQEDAAEDRGEALPEGRYRCYIIRAGDGGTLGPAQRPGSAADPTGGGMSGVQGKYQGHLNILPDRQYDWFGKEENRGRYAYDPESGEILWEGGAFGDGSVASRLDENSAGTPIIRMHYTFEDGSIDHSCRLAAS